MTLCRAQVKIPHSSAIDAHAVVNTWYFDLSLATPTVADDVMDNLTTFYAGMNTYKSPAYTWNQTSVTWYNMEDPEPRQPFAVDVMTTLGAAASSQTLPPELAICVSFTGLVGSGTNPASKRGRVYLGPWSPDACNDTTGHIISGCYTALNNAAGTFLTASLADADWSWVVYSPTLGNYASVVSGWVDNAWDIQRRREWDATVRLTF